MISAVIADSFLFLRSRSDSFISPKSNLCKKNKTSLLHVRLLSGIGSSSSAIFEHKNIHTMHFLFVFKLFKKGRGEFLPTTIFPLANKNLYSGTRLIRTPRGHAIVSVLSGCPY